MKHIGPTRAGKQFWSNGWEDKPQIGGAFFIVFVTLILMLLVSVVYLALKSFSNDLGITDLFDAMMTSIVGEENLTTWSLGVIALCLAITFQTLAVFFLHRKATKGNWLSLVSFENRLRWQLFFKGCFFQIVLSSVAIGVLLMAANTFLTSQERAAWLTFSNWMSFPEFRPYATYLCIIACVLLAQTGAEEFICRGWLHQTFGMAIPFWPLSTLIVACLFGLAHAHYGVSGMMWIAFIGFSLGYSTLRFGGIEYAWGVHFMHNFTRFALFPLIDVEFLKRQTSSTTNDPVNINMEIAFGLTGFVLIFGHCVVSYLLTRNDNVADPDTPPHAANQDTTIDTTSSSFTSAR